MQSTQNGTTTYDPNENRTTSAVEQYRGDRAYTNQARNASRTTDGLPPQPNQAPIYDTTYEEGRRTISSQPRYADNDAQYQPSPDHRGYHIVGGLTPSAVAGRLRDDSPNKARDSAGAVVSRRGHTDNTSGGQTHTSQWSTGGQVGDVMRSTGQVGDVMRSTGQVGDVMRSTGGQVGDVMRSTGQVGDVMRSTGGQVGDVTMSRSALPPPRYRTDSQQLIPPPQPLERRVDERDIKLYQQHCADTPKLSRHPIGILKHSPCRDYAAPPPPRTDLRSRHDTSATAADTASYVPQYAAYHSGYDHLDHHDPIYHLDHDLHHNLDQASRNHQLPIEASDHYHPDIISNVTPATHYHRSDVRYEDHRQQNCRPFCNIAEHSVMNDRLSKMSRKIHIHKERQVFIVSLYELKYMFMIVLI